MTDRVVVSGRGLVTPIGVGLDANIAALKAGKSGIRFMPDWKEAGLEAQTAGVADHAVECPVMDRKNERFMSLNSRFAVVAAYEAITEAGYTKDTLPKEQTAVINGCAGSAHELVHTFCKQFEEQRRTRRITPFAVPRLMPSSAVANLSLIFGIKGESYDISAACSSGALAIVVGARLIKAGEYDLVLVGGSEETSWQQALGFNVMHALSTKYVGDEAPTASRPFDKTRDGFVLGEGAGMLLLESESHCLKRGGKPIVVLSGFAANSNATDMVAPDAESSAAVMRKAIACAGLQPSDIRYINSHGTATPVGDPIEMESIKSVFGTEGRVAVNSTKSMTGHMIGAAGAVEAAFCTLMVQHNFICPTINLRNPEESFAWADLVRETRENVDVRHALSNSFAFGGSNASLVFSRYE